MKMPWKKNKNNEIDQFVKLKFRRLRHKMKISKKEREEYEEY